jgi:glycerophosphoryl diester phosphodiesterase
MGSDWSPLNRALSAVRGFPTALVLDLSNESSTALTQVISLAAARNQKHQIILKCHSSETTEFIQRQYPGVAVTVVGRSPLEIESALALSPEPEFIEIGLSDATESIVRKIHNFGSAVSVRLLDTAEDNPLRWTQLMDMGADIVLTDFPEKFVRSIPKACGAH